MSKKLLSIFVLILTFTFTTQALASFTFSSSAITGAGATSVDTGTLYLSGSTSGKVTIAPAAAAGTYTLTLPTTAGTASQYLQTNGSGVLTWATVADPSPAGADTQVQFNDAGAFAGDAGMTYNKTTDALTLVGPLVSSNIYEEPSVSQNLAIGATALKRDVTGYYNVAIGADSMYAITSGSGNVGIGAYTFGSLTSGSSNIAIGNSAGHRNSTGSTNIFIGYNARAEMGSNYSNTIVIGSDIYNTASNQAIIGNGNTANVYFGDVSATATVNAGKYKLSALNTAPASAVATCTTGDIRWTNGYVYLCVATNTWQRAALATW